MTSQNSAYKSGVSNLLNASSPEQIGDRTSAQINADSEDPQFLRLDGLFNSSGTNL